MALVLNDRLELQSASGVKDSTGQVVLQPFETYATVSGEIVALTGRELINAKTIQATIDHRITIRNRDDVKVTHRIKFGSRIFNIATRYSNDPRYLIILATEKVGAT